MDHEDRPFGYTFEGEHPGGASSPFSNGGRNLLSENENRALLDFFTSTDFLHETSPFPAPATETSSGPADFNWAFPPPATIHQVSSTIPDQLQMHQVSGTIADQLQLHQVSSTILDQSQLHHGFHNDLTFAPDALVTNSMTHTQDDLQVASTLFSNANGNLNGNLNGNANPGAHHSNGRAYSVPDVRGLSLSQSELPNTTPTAFHNLPMVITSHGLMNEQLAALLPNHSENGSIDAQIAAQFANSQTQQHHNVDIGHVETQRSHLKRSYTYGTDSAFNASGYAAPSSNAEDSTNGRMLNDLRSPRPTMRPHRSANGRQAYSPTDQINFPVGLVEIPSDDDGQSDRGTSSEGDDGDRPAKKRRKAKSGNKDQASNLTRKTSVAMTGKNRKASVDDHSGKKKRLSTAGQKAQRENLTEEQKRSNHILSEQRRRNLIKRGFDDLHDLVPELRNGGMSKSTVLMEAALFLEKIIEHNNQYLGLSGSSNG